METVPWAAAAAASECGNTVKRNQLSTAVRSDYLTFHHTVTVCKCNVSKQSLPSFLIQNFRLIHNTALLWCLRRYNNIVTDTAKMSSQNEHHISLYTG